MAFDPQGDRFAKQLKGLGVNPSLVKRKRAGGLLTECELRAYRILQIVKQTRELCIFPQVHVLQLFDLDAAQLKGILPSGVPAKTALSNISLKLRESWFAWRSVDFIACSKDTLQMIYGIEIDDESHTEPQRARADEVKNQIFSAINVPLVRFSNAEIDALFSSGLDLMQSEFSLLWTRRVGTVAEV